MATGDVKRVYVASSNLTITNLNSLAASSTFLAGWESGAIDNTTNLYEDYSVTAMIKAGAANCQVGEIRLYLVGMLDDSTWPDVFDGTESAETVTSAEIRDAICIFAAGTATTATNDRVYYLICASVAAVFGGNMPAKFGIFITQTAQTSTNAIAASGNQVTVKGSYRNVAS